SLRVAELLLELRDLGVELARDALRPEIASDRRGRGRAFAIEDRDEDRDDRARSLEQTELDEPLEEPIDPEADSDGRNVRPLEHADEIVVSPPAHDGSEAVEVAEEGLVDRARVVVEPSRDREIDRHAVREAERGDDGEELAKLAGPGAPDRPVIEERVEPLEDLARLSRDREEVEDSIDLRA